MGAGVHGMGVSHVEMGTCVACHPCHAVTAPCDAAQTNSRAYARFRSLLQVWFKCGGSSEAPLSVAEAGRVRREELLRGREHWQWQQQQRRRQWEQQRRRPEL